MEKELLTTKQICEKLKLSTRTVTEMAKRGVIPSLRLSERKGSCYRFYWDEVIGVLRDREPRKRGRPRKKNLSKPTKPKPEPKPKEVAIKEVKKPTVELEPEIPPELKPEPQESSVSEGKTVSERIRIMTNKQES